MDHLIMFSKFYFWVDFQWLLRIYVPSTAWAFMDKTRYFSSFGIHASHWLSKVDLLDISSTVVSTVWFKWFVGFNPERLLTISINLLEVVNLSSCRNSARFVFILFLMLQLLTDRLSLSWHLSFTTLTGDRAWVNLLRKVALVWICLIFQLRWIETPISSQLTR